MSVERDQRVADAISQSDLLIEIDDAGVIAFLAGALERLGAGAARSPVGLAFVDILEPDDRAAARDYVAGIVAGAPPSSLMVRLRRGGARITLIGGCRQPQDRTVLFVGLGDHTSERSGWPNLIAETERGMMSRPIFMALALRRIPEDVAGGFSLSLIEVVGFNALAQHLSAAVMWSLASAIGRQVRAAGPGIEAIGDLGPGRFGVVYRGALNIADLRHAVVSLVSAVAPAAAAPMIAAATVSPGHEGMLGRHAARVLRYALERFAAADRAPAHSGTASELAGLFTDTAQRVAGLEEVIHNGAFDLAYQPVVRLDDRSPSHAEALVRFPSGLSPLAAVTAAEAAGMIGDFDLAICARAIDHLHSENPVAPATAVNLSGRSLENRIFVDQLLSLLATRNAPPSRLMFELTEAVILGEVERVNGVVQGLRQRGFRFCLDDVGSGANSFHYLRSIPVDYVKIDGAFGRAALRNERDGAFLRYVSSFCRDLGIRSIAEMIETEEDAQQYRALGIGYGQGYLFGRPVIHRPAK